MFHKVISNFSWLMKILFAYSTNTYWMWHDEWGSSHNSDDNHNDLLSTYYLPDTTVSVFCLLTHLSLKTSLSGWCCNYFNLTLRKSKKCAQGHTAKKKRNQDLEPRPSGLRAHDNLADETYSSKGGSNKDEWLNVVLICTATGSTGC